MRRCTAVYLYIQFFFFIARMHNIVTEGVKQDWISPLQLCRNFPNLLQIKNPDKQFESLGRMSIFPEKLHFSTSILCRQTVVHITCNASFHLFLNYYILKNKFHSEMCICFWTYYFCCLPKWFEIQNVGYIPVFLFSSF